MKHWLCGSTVGWLILVVGNAWGQATPPAHLAKLVESLNAAGGEAWVRRADPPRNWECGVDFSAKTTDEALKIVGETKGLIAIRVLKGGLTDKGLGYIQMLPDIEVLIVYSAKVTDEGLKAVGKLSTLTKLDLAGPRVTSKGLAYLTDLGQLKELYLQGADVRDEDLQPLKKLKQLLYLDLPTGISKSAIAELQQALPRTNIRRRANR
jgi:hypothetical protein